MKDLTFVSSNFKEMGQKLRLKKFSKNNYRNINLAKDKTLPIQEGEQIAKDELKEVKAKTYHN